VVYTYRKGKPSDCQAVYGLICELEETKLPFDRFSEIYEKQLKSKDYECLVYEQSGRVIGVLNLRYGEPLHHSEKLAEIMEFAVNSSYRENGIGKELFAAACERAKAAGCVQIELSCNQRRSGAHRFYERQGMKNSHFMFTKRLN